MINELVKLKFIINKKVETSQEMIELLEEINLDLLSNNLNILSLINNFKKECISNNSLLSKQQNSLYIKIDEILYKKCKHEWISDIIEESLEKEREICYCKHCFYYKKK